MKGIGIKKRTLAVIVIVLIVLAALWFLRGQTSDEHAAISPQATSSLVALDGAESAASPAQQTEAQAAAKTADPENETAPDEYGEYTAKEDIAAYLVAYGKLPENFITKSEARALGWDGGGLDDCAYGKCIGGDEFGNYEGLLPEEAGRTYYECDVDTLHQNERGAKRIVFSSDGLIYYTDDHYESFTQLYPTP
ncbi:MAG TPA: ribonuclease domain-containing protein [Feifaniaceae bacterium]|nr:ribonuclease domain-containing protein [Feifaniaceae bacterium]